MQYFMTKTPTHTSTGLSFERAPLRAALLASLALFSLGCVEIIGIEDTQIEPGRDLSCVGNVTNPVGSGGQVEIVAQIVDIAGSEGPPGVMVIRCNSRLGVNCSPVEDAVRPDAMGIVRVPVTPPFNGYLRIVDDPDATDGEDWVPYLWYFSQPIVSTRAEPFPVQAMTEGFREFLLYPTDSATQNPSLGEIAINAVDCTDTNAPNIHFEITTPSSEGPSTAPFYFSNGMVVISSSVANERTDAFGLGGYRGLEPGSIGIEAYIADTWDEAMRTGTLVAEDTLLIEPGTLTTVRLLPQ